MNLTITAEAAEVILDLLGHPTVYRKCRDL